MANFPEIPAKVVDSLNNDYPGFRGWHQDFKSFMTHFLSTFGDITILTPGTGIVISNAAGTITKRIRLNNAGTDILVESV